MIFMIDARLQAGQYMRIAVFCGSKRRADRNDFKIRLLPLFRIRHCRETAKRTGCGGEKNTCATLNIKLTIIVQ